MMTELDTMKWDFVSINETWCSCEQEYFTLKGGHVFCGSGGELGAKGVAIVVNKRWASKIIAFTRVNERMAYFDISLHTTRLRIATAYFPYSGYADVHVQNMYTALSAIRRESTRQRRSFILCGDFNAETGSRKENDDVHVIGQHGLNEENARGQWMKQWATSNNLVVTNTRSFQSALAIVRHTLDPMDGHASLTTY